MVATFDEIFTKSEQVRRKLLNILIDNLKEKGVNPLKVERLRLYFNVKDLGVILKTFGIKKVYEGVLLKNYDELINYLNSLVVKDSFKFVVKRIDKTFPKNSLEIARELGALLLSKNSEAFVDLKNPRQVFYVEIHKDKVFFSYKQYEGLGGLPLKSEGKTLALFSGGIDSPVAVFSIAKRGVYPKLLFFSNGNPLVEFKVGLVFEKLNEYLNTELYVARFKADISDFLRDVRKGYKQIAFKYLIYKLSENFAKKEGLFSITTGESLGQVSTQTLKSLYLLDNSIDSLVLRPILAFDKDEIKKLAERIGTLSFSELIDETCTIEKHSIPEPDENTFMKEIKKLSIEKLNLEVLNFDDIKESLMNHVISFEKAKENFDIIEITNLKPKKIIELVKGKENVILVCKTGSYAWKIANKFFKERLREGTLFAASRKDLKINYFELLDYLNKN